MRTIWALFFVFGLAGLSGCSAPETRRPADHSAVERRADEEQREMKRQLRLMNQDDDGDEDQCCGCE